MSEELKPCPFCGGGAQSVHGAHSTFIRCVSCRVEAVAFSSYHEAARFWNRRDTTAVQREREECAKVLDGFEQEFLSRAEESIQRNNPASARFEKSRALELKSYAAAIRRRRE